MPKLHPPLRLRYRDLKTALVDNFSRESLAIEVGQRLTGDDVVKVLERVTAERGKPQTIRVDNGPEFISTSFDLWAYFQGVKLDFSRPGKPTDNSFIESFNGRCALQQTHLGAGSKLKTCLSETRFQRGLYVERFGGGAVAATNCGYAFQHPFNSRPLASNATLGGVICVSYRRNCSKEAVDFEVGGKYKRMPPCCRCPTAPTAELSVGP